MIFNYPIRESWVLAAAEQYDLIIDTEVNKRSGDRIEFKQGKLIIPCDRLNEDYKDIPCVGEEHNVVHLDVHR